MNKKTTKLNAVPIFLKNKGNRILLENLVSLSVLQVANYLLPLLTLPYLVRILGVEKFGLIVFAQVLVQYFIVIADYGFDLTATRDISIHRSDRDRICRIFSTVMVVKLALLLASFLVMLLIVFLFARFREHALLYLLTFGWAVGLALFPQWFFQGMERMKYIALLNFIAKLFFTITIFVFVKSANDYLIQPLLFSLSFILSGVIAQYKVRQDFNIHFVMPSVTDVKCQLREGWHIFLSTMSMTAYSYSNTIILGLLAGNIYVGYFAVADKVIYAARLLVAPLRQALFPFMSKRFSESREAGLRVARKAMKVIGSITLAESLAIFVFAVPIVRVIAGGTAPESIAVLRIMAVLPFITGVSNVLGQQIMLPMGYNRGFSYILAAAGALNTILAFVLVPFLKHVGISLAVAVTETFVAVAIFYFLKRKGVRLNGDKTP